MPETPDEWITEIEMLAFASDCGKCHDLVALVRWEGRMLLMAGGLAAELMKAIAPGVPAPGDRYRVQVTKITPN